MQPIVILANGEFPSHEIPLSLLRQARRLVCCDGAYRRMLDSGMSLNAADITVIGDGDSLSEADRKGMANFVHVAEQNTNDLNKATRFALQEGADEIVYLGATGLREDHTLGNISVMVDFANRYTKVRFRMVSDFGTFTPVVGKMCFDSFPRQQVSLFQFAPDVEITTHGLQWDVERRSYSLLWQGTLNAALGENFEVEAYGEVLVYQTHDPK